MYHCTIVYWWDTLLLFVPLLSMVGELLLSVVGELLLFT